MKIRIRRIRKSFRERSQVRGSSGERWRVERKHPWKSFRNTKGREVRGCSSEGGRGQRVQGPGRETLS